MQNHMERHQDGQEASARARFRPQPLLGVLWERLPRQGEEFRISHLNTFGRALGS